MIVSILDSKFIYHNKKLMKDYWRSRLVLCAIQEIG